MKKLTILAAAVIASLTTLAEPLTHLATARLASVSEMSAAVMKLANMAKQPQRGMMLSGMIQMGLAQEVPELRQDGAFAGAVYAEEAKFRAAMSGIGLRDLDNGKFGGAVLETLSAAVIVPVTKAPAALKDNRDVYWKVLDVPGFGKYAAVATNPEALAAIEAEAASLLAQSGDGQVVSIGISPLAIETLTSMLDQMLTEIRREMDREVAHGLSELPPAIRERLKPFVSAYFGIFSRAVASLGDVKSFDLSLSVANDGVVFESVASYRPGTPAFKASTQKNLPAPFAALNALPAGSLTPTPLRFLPNAGRAASSPEPLFWGISWISSKHA